jgi:hypothetical protein
MLMGSSPFLSSGSRVILSRSDPTQRVLSVSSQGITRQPKNWWQLEGQSFCVLLFIIKILFTPGLSWLLTLWWRHLPAPTSSLLAFSLGWLTLGKQVLHYAWLLGMRSVLVSNSLAEQPQGYRPCKNPRCLPAQEGFSYNKKALLK